MPKGQFVLTLGPCKPGYSYGPPPELRLGLLTVTYHAEGYEAAVRRGVDEGMQDREARVNAMLVQARTTYEELLRMSPGAANAAGQRSSAPGGVVPSHPPGSPKLDAVPGGVPHFRGDI